MSQDFTSDYTSDFTSKEDLRSRDQFQNFAYHYDLFFSHNSFDSEFYRTIAARLNRPNILDIACGTGRISLPLLQAGYSVTGVDLSADMLEIFRQKLELEPTKIKNRARLLQGDMARLNELFGSEKFDLIILGFNSFPHLFTEADQEQCLSAVHSLLKHDGQFVLGLSLPNLRQPYEHLYNHEYAPSKVETYVNPKNGSKMTCKSILTDYPEQELVQRDFNFVEELPDGTANRFVVSLTTGFIYPDKLRNIFERVGLKLQEEYGDYDFTPFTKKSSKLLCVCTKE